LCRVLPTWSFTSTSVGFKARRMMSGEEEQGEGQGQGPPLPPPTISTSALADAEEIVKKFILRSSSVTEGGSVSRSVPIYTAVIPKGSLPHCVFIRFWKSGFKM